MPEIDIKLLGTPTVSADGIPLVTDTRKAVALLAYLALSGAASRDRLAELLWPEAGQKKSRAALRRTLSALSEARSSGWLVVDRENISLDGKLVSTDVTEFRSLISERRDESTLTAAVELWRGDFMAGFALRDSAAFDDWQFFEGEEARRGLIGALDALSKIKCAKGDWEAATTHARRWLSLDRMNESAHRRLMEIYAWSGRRSAALKQYDECENILADELGVSPLEETILLYRAIRADTPPPPPNLDEERKEPATTVHQTKPARSTFFGREVEMNAMFRAYEGDGRVVILEGEAGIGKTRLAEEFLAKISADGSTAITAHCYESERAIAYGPFIEALSALAADPLLQARLADVLEVHLTEAARIAPGLTESHSEPPPLDTPGAWSRFFESVAQVISAAASGVKPGVFFVDDAHLADVSSLELLAYLSRRLPKIGAVRLLLTRRIEEVRDPLRKFREEARRTGGMVGIPVSRLGPEAVGEMSAATPGASPEMTKRLFEETEGVPLFVEEYLRGISSGVFVPEDEAWLPPGGVRDVILGRLEAVGQTGRQVLAAAAAVGRSFDFDTVREASGRSEEEALDAVEELVSRGIISEVKDPHDATYDFSHGQLRAVVYEETSLARKRILHRRIAAALGKKRDAAPARIARHHLLAGEDEEAARHFALAGEKAARLYANAEALAHFEAALSLGHPEESGLREEIGDLHTLAGDYAAALSDYENALPHTDDPSRLERKLGGVYQRLGERESAEEHFLRAMESSRTAPERATLHAELGLLAHGGGDAAEAFRHAEESLRLAGESGDALTLARTHGVAATVARGAGEMERARDHLEKSLAFSGEVEAPSIRIAALNNLALVLGESGETEEAVPAAEEALALCRKLGDRHHEAALRNNLADLLHAAGREEESRENQREAVAIFAEIGDGEWRPGIWKLVEW